MESYEHLEPQLDGLDLGLFSATGPQTFLSQPGAPHGPSPGFHIPELSSQARGYPPRSYGYQGVPRFPPQAPGAGRPVNIVLPNSGTDAQSLLLISKVERLEHEMLELRRGQEEIKTLLQKMKDSLDDFISSVTIADQQPGETPKEASSGVA
ncbi:hypothetical protein VTK26DRAFT_3863 [Humicola hyalothermophila]